LVARLLVVPRQEGQEESGSLGQVPFQGEREAVSGLLEGLVASEGEEKPRSRNTNLKR
jgi:hypothetical protein